MIRKSNRKAIIDVGRELNQRTASELAELSPGKNWKPATGNDPFATCVDRRAFLRGGAGLVGGLALSAPLQTFLARKALGCTAVRSPYGAISPKPDHSTGLNLIQLPDGFEYWSFGWTGETLSDGNITPNLHDGMAVLSQEGDHILLCRNHETGAGKAFAMGATLYSPVAAGGNTNLIWNTRTKQLEEHWASLSGTIRNCAGGPTPWGTWIAGEETSDSAPDSFGLKHGYNFEVGPEGALANFPIALKQMGRFSHEAVAVDPATGIVYETEDAGNTSGFYRYIPNVPGQLYMGGQLQMLKIVGVDQFSFVTTGCVNDVWDVEWVTIANPDAPTGDSTQPESTFGQGAALGGAAFARLEGCWYGMGKIYFVATSGGLVSEGQVFEYDPASDTLRLIYASPAQSECENPDNITVTPRGGLLLCEDNSGSTSNPGERLLGLTLDGEIFTFALNNMDFTKAGLGPYTHRKSGITYATSQVQNEWAGATYTPDGQWLFVNNQTPGITFAIRPVSGDWGRGPL